MTINGSTNNANWTFKLEAYETSYSVSNNNSQVTVDMYIGRARSRSYLGGNWSANITADGQTQSLSGNISYPTYINGGEWLYLGSRSYTIGHNNDGTKTANISASFSSSDFTPSSASANGNLLLTTIPRGANITNSPTTFTDEENPWFNYSNPANASLSCWLEPYPNGTHYAERTLSGTSGTYTWNLTEAERNQLRNALKNATNSRATCRIGLYSTIGSTTFTSYVDRTLIITNANPIFNSVNVYDSNTTTKALTGNNKTIIKGHSNVKSVFNPANVQAIKYATLKTYMADTLSASYSSTQEINIINVGYTKSSIKTQVIDSRGNSTSITIDFTKGGYNFIDYQDIVKNSISVNRSDGGVGKFVTLKFDGTYWNGNFGAVNNELEVSYKYKKTTSSQYITGTTTIIPTINNNEFSFDGLVAGDTLDNGFDINSTYDIIVTVSDKLSTVDFQTVIGAGSPAIAIYGNKVALGDKYDTSLGGIQLWGDIYINGQLFSRGDE